MATYHNKHHEKNARTQSGPYVFVHGLIRTNESTDKTVGPILTRFYGCVQIEDVEGDKILQKYKSTASGKAAADKAAADKAAADKAAADKAAADKAAADKAAADKAAAADKVAADKAAADKAAADKAAALKTKPEDKM